MLASYLPYCGTAPIAWTFDVVLVGLLAAAYGLGVRLMSTSGTSWERIASLAGRGTVAAALISPLLLAGATLL